MVICRLLCRASSRWPLLGPLQPLLTTWKLDYAGGSQIFVSKIQSLKRSACVLRRTRQDGLLLQKLLVWVLKRRKSRPEVDRLIACLEGWKAKLIAIGRELVLRRSELWTAY
jgi:hypothetical protein